MSIMNNELYEKLTRLQWLLHKRQLRDWAEDDSRPDLARGQGRILAILKLHDGISARDLSYLLGMAASSLNELLFNLEEGGYVTLEQSTQDNRVMLVKLTKKGEAEEQADRSDFGDIFACLSDDEQQSLNAYLDRVIEALQENVGGDNDVSAHMKAARERFGRDSSERFGHDFQGRFGVFGHNSM
jgi:DNA-binding MarR family transcriptional regulator